MRKRRRRRANKPLRTIFGCFLVFCLLYIFVWPALELFVFASPAVSNASPGFELLEEINLRSIEVFFANWFFFVGSAIGSFANVVVYRTPRKMSVAGKDSACPYCRQRIKLRHNIPVFGWLILRGRCFKCRLPISPRYPIVELIFGLAFLALYFATLFRGGTNIPGMDEVNAVGLLDMINRPNWFVIGTYLLQAFILSILLIWALIRYDEFPIPLRTILLAFTVALIVPSIFPQLRPIGIDAVSGDLNELAWSSSLLTGLVGCVAGIVVGTVSSVIHSSSKSDASIGLLPGFGLIGAYVGWQTTLLVGIAFALFLVPSRLLSFRLVSKKTLPDLFPLSISVLVVFSFWNQLSGFAFLPGRYLRLEALIVFLVSWIGCWLLIRLLGKPASHTEAKF